MQTRIDLNPVFLALLNVSHLQDHQLYSDLLSVHPFSLKIFSLGKSNFKRAISLIDP